MIETELLSKRVTQVEGSLRIWRIIALANFLGLAAVIAAMCIDMNAETPAVIKAQKFQLVDETGVERASLHTMGYGTVLRMYSNPSGSDLAIGTNPMFSFVNLSSDNHANFAGIQTYPEGGLVQLWKARDSKTDDMAITQVRGGAEGAYMTVRPFSETEVRIPAE